MSGEIAVGFFRHGTEVLLVRYADRSPERWDAVSVPIPVRSDADENSVRRRLGSAVGIDTPTFVRSADPIEAGNDTIERPVRPYLFECDARETAFDESIAAGEWVQPPAMLDREIVPGLWRAYRSIAPSVRTIREDTEHGAGFVSLRALEALRDRAATAAVTDEGYEPVAATARDLRRARPSMRVIETRIDRVMANAERTPASVRDRAMAACTAAVRAGETAAERAASVLGDRVLTLSRSGTVRSALEAARPDSAFVAESRPAREGVGVAERLAEAGIDVTLLVDAAMEGLIARGAVDTVLVGADAILEDGSVINKTGTRTAMRAGVAAEIDSYAVCSRDKIAPGTEFDPEFGSPGAVYRGDADIAVHNPTFERVPPTAVSGIVTEGGIYSPEGVGSIAREHATHSEWDE
jgi:translation initiation factor 2B subunit (eIF-2B alpha/beta/delta family)